MTKKLPVNPLNIVVIGVERLSAPLLPPLCRVLNDGSEMYRFDRPSVLVVDATQAESAAANLHREFHDIGFAACQAKVTEENVAELTPEGAVVFCCVNNLATVKIISDHCSKLRNVTAIRGGCGFLDGMIQVFARREGKNITLPIANEYHPELDAPKDEDCSGPQLVITNFAVASMMLNAFHAVLTDRISYSEAYLDVVSQNVRSFERRSCR